MDKAVLIFLLVLVTLVARMSFAQDTNSAGEHPQFKEAIKDFQAGRWTKARSALLQLVELEPQQQIYWFNLGHVYYKFHDFSQASDSYRKVRELQLSLAGPATYYLAVCENNRGRSKKALELIDTIIENPETQENLRKKAVHFKKAVQDEDDEASAAALKYFNDGNYEQSLKEIDKSELSETPEAFLLRGLSLKSLNKREEAKKYFRLAERYTQKTDIRESSRNLAGDLNESEKTSLHSGWSGGILFNGGSDSNVYQVQAATATAMTEVNAEVNYRHDSSPQWSLIPGYSFKQSRYFISNSLNTADHFLMLDAVYDTAHWLFEAVPFIELMQSTYDLVTYGSDYLVKWDEENWALGFSGSTARQESRSTAEAYMDGPLQSTKLFLELKNPLAMVQLYVAEMKTETGDLPVNLGSQSGLLPLAYSGRERGIYTVVSLKDRWRIYGRIARIEKDYDQISTPTNVKRNDVTTNLLLKVKYDFSRSLSGFSTFNFLNNQSTLGAGDVEDKNYAELISKFGLQWSW